MRWATMSVGAEASPNEMSLDRDVCSRARLARDARFDGKFFIAVITTKIYCRPICRTRLSMEKNVRYFPTSAAAAEAGFRPCLRCRPECSPGSPVWAGTRNTVSRALRLMAENGLEDGGLEDLARRVGVGSRHLRRLFLRHVGATPAAVAQSVRLHFAKKLIDETRLPVTQVALASGFGSVRRFNATIRNVYRRTPTQIRALARPVPAGAENEYLFQLSFRPPYNWKRMLEFLADHATPGVEAIDAGTYRRSISMQGADGYFEIAQNRKCDGLSLRIHFGRSQCLFPIIERIRAMFDLNADWEVIWKALRSDRELAARADAEPGVRVPGCWSGFEAAVRAVLEQEGSANEASALAGRLALEFGRAVTGPDGVMRLFPTAESMAKADLIALGLPAGKAETIHALSRAVLRERVKFELFADCDVAVAQLREIPGFTTWAAQYVAMRALRDPDAFPSEDTELARAFGNCSSRELEGRSEAWRPWRAYAAMLVWQSSGRRADSALLHIPATPSGQTRAVRARRAVRASEG
jgi:AraC family transcriptional regulator, regulatory protein of adaptative response / DNA-3-methyladenine glycosylase II